MVILPLTSDPCRSFVVRFNEADYRITTKFNERSQVWTLDIENPDTDEAIVNGMPVLLGGDMLRGFAPQLGTMYAIDESAAVQYGTDAGPEDLGDRINVLWIAPGEAV